MENSRESIIMTPYKCTVRPHLDTECHTNCCTSTTIVQDWRRAVKMVRAWTDITGRETETPGTVSLERRE